MTAAGNTIRWEQDADGIVILTLDERNQRNNTVNAAFQGSLHAAVTRLRAEVTEVTGVIVTSAKDSFLLEGSPELPEGADETEQPIRVAGQKIAADLRVIETLGRPVVAALNGSAIGAGYEVALAAHHRIAIDNPRARFGLPQITWGLMPAAGGVVRTTRLLGVAAGLTNVLLKGTEFRASEALALGLLDEVVPTPEHMMSAAKAWILRHPESIQRWDDPGYRMPGGPPSSPELSQQLAAFPAHLRRESKGAPVPASQHVMAAAVEGAAVDVQNALLIESRYFADLARGQTAKNMTQAFWHDMEYIRGGGSRPAGQPARPTRRLAVIGAGLMGSGIALISAQSGVNVVLKDVSLETARRGKEQVRGILEKAISRGKATHAERDEVLARIVPTDSYADLAGSDLVIEAVPENLSLKHDVLYAIDQVVDEQTLLASNTSTLPITELASGVRRESDFIGLHFFSPADKMPLLEIIRGRNTSDATLARALDFAIQIGKTPIVVNDSHGFFTSRVFGVFIKEALAMLGEGIAPATIEQATTQAGYPVGALQLADELNMDLMLKIRDEQRTAEGETYVAHPGENVFEKMVALGRPGRLAGSGFFDYDDTGKRSGVWPGLTEHFPWADDPAAVDLGRLQERLLFVEALESARCVEEGVLVTAADGNVGSLLGIGFPAWTGGVLQFVSGYRGAGGVGVAGFVRRADALADDCGERFRPTKQLRDRARQP